ncbi:MAG: hypothetical protein KDB07_11975, partial [Planctomycetes bacterium]|nr:hypothetical protein [Planctomycetota bacterium]
MRCSLTFAACTAALVFSASLFAATQVGQPNAGFTVTDTSTHMPNRGTNGYDVGANSLVADPRDNEAVFYFDGDEIRRYDFADGQDLPVFDVPALASADAPGGLSNIQDATTMSGEVWGSFLRFDPANPERLIFGESSGRSLREYTLSSTNRTSVTASRTIYQTSAGEDWSPYDASFLTTGELLLVRGGSIAGDPFTRLTLVDASTTPSTIVDLAELPGYSGPSTVESSGHLLYLVPQDTNGVTNSTQLLLASWSPQQITEAMSNPVANALTIANATTERLDNFAAFT